MRLFVRILVCLAICAWLLANTRDWQKAAESYEARFEPALDLPGAKKPYFFDNDCYYWLSYAERMVADGEWRIRYTHIDNVPYGREMHWSQSMAWLEVAFGKIRSLATGEPWLEAIPRAAIWVNPALLAVGLCLLFCLLDGCLGFLPAAISVFWMLSLSDLAWAFQPYRPDHQSLHLLFSLSTFVLLLIGGLGWTSARPRDKAFRWFAVMQPPSEKIARRCFIASGIAGGLSLWIGATLQVFCLGCVGVGVLSGAFLFRKNGDAGQEFVPGLFRLWGWAGAATSLLMYAVEYLPDHYALRLEVNHPLYALSWLAAAELLALIFGICFGQRALTRREWGLGVLLVGVAAILPAVLYFGGEQVHAMRDMEMFRLHKFVTESQSYFKTSDLFAFFGGYLALPLCLPTALALAFFAPTSAMERWALWTGSVVCLGMLALMFLEQRWAAYYAQFGVVLMALTLASGSRLLNGPARVVTLALAAAMLGASALFLFSLKEKNLTRLLRGEVLDKPVAQRILMKRFAVQMAHLVKAGDVRLLAEPTLAPSLYYFGGLRSTVTFYWENRAGLHAAADFFDADDENAARRIAVERGLTHVVMPDNGSVPLVFHQVRTGELPLSGSLDFAGGLIKGVKIPAWMTRDTSMTNLANCVFGSYRVAYPMSVWKIDPEGSKDAP